MAVSTPVCDFGWPAPFFALPATDGRMVSLADVARPKGTLVLFICNHCPYVLAVLDRIIRDAEDLLALEIGVVAISSSDVTSYPEDSFDKMKKMAVARGFLFPYLYDEDQSVARDYGAALWRGVYARLLRLRCGWRSAISRAARCLPQGGRADGPAPRSL